MLIFRQLFDKDSSTYTYLIADSTTKEAVIVDSVKEQVERDLTLLQELGLNLKYVLDTHVHADHVTGAAKLRDATNCKIVVPSPFHNAFADISLKDKEQLQIGDIIIKAIATPGHTNAHMAYLVNNDRVLTGDALFIRGCGRTDFQEGNASTLYDSVTQHLFTLPDETLVFPGHDYKGLTCSTIGEEKEHNLRLAHKSKEKFIEIMKNLNLPKPKNMEFFVAQNEQSGRENEVNLSQEASTFSASLLPSHGFWKNPEDIKNINVQDLKKLLDSESNLAVVDVRSEAEYNKSGPLDPKVKHIPLNQLKERLRELDPHKPTITYCYAGNRGSKAAQLLQENQFKSVLNLEGGIAAWSDTFGLETLKQNATEGVNEFKKTMTM